MMTMRSSVTWLISGVATAPCPNRPASAFENGCILVSSLIPNGPKNQMFLPGGSIADAGPSHFGHSGSKMVASLFRLDQAPTASTEGGSEREPLGYPGFG